MTTTTDERSPLAEFAEQQGWSRRVSDTRGDVFLKGTVRIKVVWAGDDAVSGATLFHDEMYESYTRELSTLKAWLKR